MKTIAISIDEDMLEAVDKLSAGSTPGSTGPPGANRSALVRRAIALFLEQEERRRRETEDARIFKAQRDQLTRQAAALVKEQAEP